MSLNYPDPFGPPAILLESLIPYYLAEGRETPYSKRKEAQFRIRHTGSLATESHLVPAQERDRDAIIPKLLRQVSNGLRRTWGIWLSGNQSQDNSTLNRLSSQGIVTLGAIVLRNSIR